MQATETAMLNSNSANVYPQEAQALMDRRSRSGDVVILDVSTPSEFARRHIATAVNVSFLSPLFASRIRKFDRDRTYLLTCKVGCRSRMARRLMVKFGFASVYGITGGNLLWEEEGLPFSGNGKVPRWSLCPMTGAIKTGKWVKRMWGTLPRAGISDDCFNDCRTMKTDSRPSATPE